MVEVEVEVVVVVVAMNERTNEHGGRLYLIMFCDHRAVLGLMSILPPRHPPIL